MNGTWIDHGLNTPLNRIDMNRWLDFSLHTCGSQTARLFLHAGYCSQGWRYQFQQFECFDCTSTLWYIGPQQQNFRQFQDVKNVLVPKKCWHKIRCGHRESFGSSRDSLLESNGESLIFARCQNGMSPRVA